MTNICKGNVRNKCSGMKFFSYSKLCCIFFKRKRNELNFFSVCMYMCTCVCWWVEWHKSFGKLWKTLQWEFLEQASKDRRGIKKFEGQKEPPWKSCSEASSTTWCNTSVKEHWSSLLIRDSGPAYIMIFHSVGVGILLRGQVYPHVWWKYSKDYETCSRKMFELQANGRYASYQYGAS